jgi:hypothetical protein
MSKTHSQQLSKETGYSIALVIGMLLYISTAISMVAPGLVELLTQTKSTIGTDPIDKTTVNEAIKLIQPQ